MKKNSSGGAFRKLTMKLKSKGAYNPKALASYIGRKKYGKKVFQAMALAGKRKSNARVSFANKNFFFLHF